MVAAQGGGGGRDFEPEVTELTRRDGDDERSASHRPAFVAQQPDPPDRRGEIGSENDLDASDGAPREGPASCETIDLAPVPATSSGRDDGRSGPTAAADEQRRRRSGAGLFGERDDVAYGTAVRVRDNE